MHGKNGPTYYLSEKLSDRIYYIIHYRMHKLHFEAYSCTLAFGPLSVYRYYPVLLNNPRA